VLKDERLVVPGVVPQTCQSYSDSDTSEFEFPPSFSVFFSRILNSLSNSFLLRPSQRGS
jgi:hypothetical protein